MTAADVQFTVIGWTDSGTGFRPHPQAQRQIGAEFWTAAVPLRDKLIGQPPENVQTLTGIPVWGLCQLSVQGHGPLWCFTVQSRGAGHLAGTTQFAFTTLDHPATYVWQAAAALIGSGPDLKDRLPWVQAGPLPAQPPVPPRAGEPDQWSRAAADLLTGLLVTDRGITVDVPPELMATLVPAVLSVLPPHVTWDRQWLTCLLNRPKSATGTGLPPLIVGRWSEKMRGGLSGGDASAVDAWLDQIVKLPPRHNLEAAHQRTAREVAAELCRLGPVNPGLVARDDDPVDALRHVVEHLSAPADVDVPELFAKRKWRLLEDHLPDVTQFAEVQPVQAAHLVAATLRHPHVAEALMKGLRKHLPDDAVLDALGVPPAAPPISDAAAWLDWLGQLIAHVAPADQLVERLTGRDGRLGTDGALVAAAPLFSGLGLDRERQPDLFPFDVDGVVQLIVGGSQWNDALDRIGTAPDPVWTVRQVAAGLPEPNRTPAILGALLAAALRTEPLENREAQLRLLVEEWTERLRRAGTNASSDWLRTVDRVTDVARSGELAILVDEGLGRLAGVEVAAEQTALLASTAVRRRSGEVPGGLTGLLYDGWRDDRNNLWNELETAAAENDTLRTRPAQVHVEPPPAEHWSPPPAGTGRDGGEDPPTGPRALLATRNARIAVAVVVLLFVGGLGLGLGLLVRPDPKTPRSDDASPAAQRRDEPAQWSIEPPGGCTRLAAQTLTVCLSGTGRTSGPFEVVVVVQQIDAQTSKPAQARLLQVKFDQNTSRYVATTTFDRPAGQVTAWTVTGDKVASVVYAKNLDAVLPTLGDGVSI